MDTTEYLEELAADALERGITPAVRINRLRNLAETYADIRDAITATRSILSGTAIAAATGRDQIHLDLAALERSWEDLAGILPFSNAIDPLAANTGTANNFPLIRQLATPITRDMVPGLPDPVAATGLVNAAGDYTGATFVIDSVVDGKPDTAGAAFPMSIQTTDWADQTGRRMIDQILTDVVDRAAENHIGAAIATAATPLAGDSATLSATLAEKLDAAEGQASAGAASIADLLLVNPVDWPTIRRAVATTWTDQLPHPRPIVSVGIPAGDAYLAASVALVLQAGELQFAQVSRPQILGRETAVSREFRGVVRHAAGVVKITL